MSNPDDHAERDLPGSGGPAALPKGPTTKTRRVRFVVRTADGRRAFSSRTGSRAGGEAEISEEMWRKHFRGKRVFKAKFPEKPEESFDSERDWFTWRDVLTEQERGALPPHPGPKPNDKAIQAARLAARGWTGIGRPDERINSTSLVLAAALTAQFAQVTALYSEIPPFRWDLLIEALNRYPHPCSTAALWLTPALRNFLGEPRESPEDLVSEWNRQARRSHRLTVHPKSVIFQGHLPRHGLIDLEDRSVEPDVVRTKLERWRIQAHLYEVPEKWEFKSGLYSGLWPAISSQRVRELNRYAREVLDTRTASKYELEPDLQEWRSFLLREAQRSRHPRHRRRLFRQCLQQLHRAVLRRLVTRPVTHLDEEHVREYDMLLGAIRSTWKATERSPRDARMRRRLEFVVQRGWPRNCLIQGRKIGDCRSREVAASLLCVRQSIDLDHPQTVLGKIAEARKALHVMKGGTTPRKRGRPPKPREFNPTSIESD